MREFARVEGRNCMTKLKASLLVGLCILGYGCAASTDELNALEVGSDTQALEKGRAPRLG